MTRPKIRSRPDLAPISQELYTQKSVELLVLAVLHNPRSDMKRFWFMTPEAFFDRISSMREMWQKWMLEQVAACNGV